MLDIDVRPTKNDGCDVAFILFNDPSAVAKILELYQMRSDPDILRFGD